MVSRAVVIFAISFATFYNYVNAGNAVLKEVETPNGKIVGQEFFSRNGRSYFGFRGVPYGKIPERFQVAEPYPSWTNSRKALEFGNSCSCLNFVKKTIMGEEDCLFLNVYTPFLSNNKDNRLPVMVWIHGGGFETGSSSDFDAKYFMDEDTVLVTINYRTGALGFLSTDDSVVAGNMGMKDQVLALKWVQSNINAFGGDQNRVTIFGESAGGASVHYHLLSPMSKDLFQNAISQSGSALNFWSFQKSPKSNAETFAKYLDCPIDSTKILVDCLKSKTHQELVAAQLRFNRWALFPINTFAPTVELYDSGKPKFLPENPEQIILSGNFNRVPWIVGFNEDEGVMLSPIIIMNDNFTKDMNEKWNHVAPITLSYDHISPQKDKNEVSDKILNFYFENEEVGEETWQSLTDMFSDRGFIHAIDKAAKLHAKFSPVYPYVFTFPGGDPTVLRVMTGMTGEYGVGHGDELQYQFNGVYGSPEYVGASKHEPLDLSQKFVNLWVSFAKTSVPTATWDKVRDWKPISTTSTVEYYEIAAQTKIWDTDIDDRISIWNDVSQIIDAPRNKSSSSDQKDEL